MIKYFKVGVFTLFVVILTMLFGIVGTLSNTQTAQALEYGQATGLSSSDGVKPIVALSSKNDTSLPLRDLAELAPPSGATGTVDEFQRPVEAPNISDGTHDPTAVQSSLLGNSYMPLPIHNFEGAGNAGGGFPPDTNGDVGYDPNTSTKYYMQWNNTHISIWDVTDPENVDYILGPVPGNTIFAGFGGPCEENNDGDPIVLFDQLADRWLGTQFVASAPYYQCAAVSETADPTGAWHRYAFAWPNGFNDYPKFGVWPDGYYMSANQFTGATGAGVAALERDEMLVGDPAQFIYFDVSDASAVYTSLLPSDLDGDTLPPAGTPNYYAAFQNTSPNDLMNIWEFDVDWVTPANSTFGLSNFPNQALPTVNVDTSLTTVPQPDGASGLESLAPRLMHRLPYRYVDGTEIMVANHTVDADSTNHAGVHWMEMRKSGGPWSMYQEGIYAPDSDGRWMGSIAMDKAGNIAVGYSVSGLTTYPSIRYAGRLADDPLGILSQNETELIAGGGVQEGAGSRNRWGDYSAMTIDNTDDCTFWYTTEYYGVTSSAFWQTRVGSFVFPGCLGPTGTLEGTVTDDDTSQAIEGVSVFATAPVTYTAYSYSDANGDYAIILGTGSYAVTASAYGYAPEEVTNVPIDDGVTTVQDFALTPEAFYTVEGTVMDADTGRPLYAHIAIEGDPLSPPAPDNEVWTDPDTGFYEVTLSAGNSYTFNVKADDPGYNPESRDVGPLTGNVMEDFDLTVNQGLCTAPGYAQETTYFQDFEATDGGYDAAPDGEWEWGIPTYANGPSGAYSGDNLWGTDLEGDASDPPPEAHILASALLDVPAGGGYVQWWDWYGAELADIREVYVDGDLMWTDYPSAKNQRYWDKKFVDVSAWAGQQIVVEWVLDVRGGGSGPDGWYIDDVSIAELDSCLPVEEEPFIYLPVILYTPMP